jgi:hypothetical protein
MRLRPAGGKRQSLPPSGALHDQGAEDGGPLRTLSVYPTGLLRFISIRNTCFIAKAVPPRFSRWDASVGLERPRDE